MILDTPVVHSSSLSHSIPLYCYATVYSFCQIPFFVMFDIHQCHYLLFIIYFNFFYLLSLFSICSTPVRSIFETLT